MTRPSIFLSSHFLTSMFLFLSSYLR